VVPIKGMSTIQTFVIVENVIIDEFAELATSGSTGSTADKAAEQRPGDTADDCANRTFGHTDARTTGGSSQGADGAGRLSPTVVDGDAHAVTVGTN